VTKVSSANLAHNIGVPTLALNAHDDPICPSAYVPHHTAHATHTTHPLRPSAIVEDGTAITSSHRPALGASLQIGACACCGRQRKHHLWADRSRWPPGLVGRLGLLGRGTPTAHDTTRHDTTRHATRHETRHDTTRDRQCNGKSLCVQAWMDRAVVQFSKALWNQMPKRRLQKIHTITDPTTSPLRHA
jgi:hypothetical protein